MNISTFENWQNLFHVFALLITLLVGIGFTYFGYWLYKLAIYLVGAFWGAIVGTLLGYAAAPELVWIFSIVGFLLGGMLALIIHEFIIFGIGALIGVVLGLVMGVTEPGGLLFMACASGGLMLALNKLMVIVITSCSGSFLLLIVFINLGLLAGQTERAFVLPSFASYLKYLLDGYIKGQDLTSVAYTAGGDLLAYILLVASGIIGQYYLLHRGFRLFKPKRQNQNGTSLASHKESTVEKQPGTAAASYGVTLYMSGQWVCTLPLENAEPLQVGRSDDNDLPLQDTNVSRKHCTLTLQDGRLLVQDQNSTNGTWLSGQQKIQRMLLNLDEWVELGGSKLVFHTL